MCAGLAVSEKEKREFTQRVPGVRGDAGMLLVAAGRVHAPAPRSIAARRPPPAAQTPPIMLVAALSQPFVHARPRPCVGCSTR